MAPPAALAFVRSEEGLARMPPDCRVVPLRPGLAVPAAMRLVDRPEALLTPEDARTIESDVARTLETWRPAEVSRALTWRGVDLGGCLDYELRLVVLDLLKTARVITAAAERVHPGLVLTDVPPVRPPFPPYPYLTGTGSVLASIAESRGWRFSSVAPPTPATPPPPRKRVAQAYVAVASRQGVARLRGKGALVAVGPHREFYAPLAAAWRSAGGATVVVTPTAAPIRPAAKEGLFLAMPASLVDRAARKEIDAFAAGVARQAPEGADLRHLGGDGASCSAPFRAHVAHRLREWLPDIACLGVGFEGDLSSAAALVLMETSSPFSSAAVRYARKAGIHVTVLQHGVIAEPSSYRLLAADRVAAWGSLDADWFRRELPRDVHVEATGSPRHDRLGAGGAASSEAITLPRDRPVALFASQPFVQGGPLRSPWERAALVAMVHEAARRSSAFRIIVKWHPSETPEPLPVPEDDALARSLHRANTLDLLPGAFAVLAVSSTVGLEAMYLGKPVVFLGPADREGPFHPPEEGGGLRARTADELAAHLGSLVADASFRGEVLAGQQDYLRRAYAPLDGRASERVVRLLRGS